MSLTEVTDPSPRAQQVSNPPYLARLDFETDRLVLTVLKTPYRRDLKLCLTLYLMPVIFVLGIGFAIDLLATPHEFPTLILWPVALFSIQWLLILFRTLMGLAKERVIILDKASDDILIDNQSIGGINQIKSVKIKTGFWGSHRRFRLYLIFAGSREVLLLQTNLLAGFWEEMQFFSDLSLEENVYLPIRWPLWTDYRGEKWGFDPKDREIFTIAEQITNFVQEYQSAAKATTEKTKSRP